MSYEAITRGAAVIDRSEMGKLLLAGPQAAEFLDGQITNDASALAVGQGAYAAFLTPKGKMLGDLRVVMIAEHELLLICERVALQALFDRLRTGLIGWDAQLHKRTLERSLVTVAGPQADDVTQLVLPHEEHANRPIDEGWAVRTDVGVDFVVQPGMAAELVESLVARGAQLADEADLEIVRVESGRPRFGIDLDESVIPQEAGLNERAVSFTKGCYVGQETVARLFYKGHPNRLLRGLSLSAPMPSGTELYDGDRKVGTLGSSVVSPALGPIGLALVRREVEPEAELRAGSVGGPESATARVKELPFAPAGATFSP